MLPRQVCREFSPLADASGSNDLVRALQELVRTNNPVLVSAVGALLDGAGIRHVVFDRNMSVLEGSVGILACRIVVADEDVVPARRLLNEAGLGNELRPDAS
jgi:hypothetical protein